MFSEFVLHDTLVITSLALLVLMGVLPFIISDDERRA
jgi:hypothetical protein